MIVFSPMPKDMLKLKSVILAPLEGITDELYRELILNHYPDWDLLFTDFYRIPRHGNKTKKKLIDHIGTRILNTPDFFNKTVVQVLTSSNDAIEQTCQDLNELKVQWLDLNAGCPMRRVIYHKGGSYLLSDLDELKSIVSRLRKNFPHFLTVKIRIGLKDDKNFYEILRMLEGEGVDAITLHGRLQSQLYAGTADWNYIAKATDILKIPLIGNGDIWKASDAFKMYNLTNCHSIMIGRPAMRAPWLAHLIKENKNEILLKELQVEIDNYLTRLFEKNLEYGFHSDQALKRVKEVSPSIFSDFSNGIDVRTKVLRSEKFETVKEAVAELVLESVSE